jgi:hypothetical protein
MTRQQTLLALSIVVCASVLAHADLRWYQVGGDYGYTYVQDTDDVSDGTAVCDGPNIDTCQSVACGVCHGAVGGEMRRRRGRHTMEQFRRAGTAVTAAPIAFGKGTLRLINGRVTLLDANGREVLRVPSDAVVLKHSSGPGQVIFYAGHSLPERVKK